MTSSRIIFVNRFFYPDQSATSRILSDLAFSLVSDRAAAISIITTRGLYDDPAADLPPFETVNGVDIHRVYRPRFSRSGLWGRAADYVAMYGEFVRAAARIAGRGDVLVAKTDPPLLSVALAPVAQWRGLRQINWLQDLYPELAVSLGLRALAPVAPALAAARNASLRRAAKNVVIGERMRAHVQSAGVDLHRIAVIPNWCDDDAIRPVAREANELRTAWGLGEKFIVGYSGNLGRAHEYQTLIGTASLLRDHADILFLFIGGGYLTARLKEEISARGLAQAFRFLPYQPEEILAQSLSVPDIHWLSQPPAMEGLILPSKFYGVAAAGRPIAVVGDPHGELSELVAQHDCGAAINVGDGEAFARFILDTKNDLARATEMGANARRMLESGFTRRHALAQWRRLLANL